MSSNEDIALIFLTSLKSLSALSGVPCKLDLFFFFGRVFIAFWAAIVTSRDAGVITDNYHCVHIRIELCGGDVTSILTMSWRYMKHEANQGV